jgi:spermidine/putrescine transport system permease protein
MKKLFSSAYIGLIFLFLYIPIFILIIFSFNASKSRSVWSGFTLDWYRQLFQNELLITALINTLVIALISSVIATIIGTAAAIGIYSMKKGEKAVMTLVLGYPAVSYQRIPPRETPEVLYI